MDDLIHRTLKFWLDQDDVAGAALDDTAKVLTVSFTNGEEFLVRFEETDTSERGSV